MHKKVSELTDSEINLNFAYEDILEMSKDCKFSDCTHTREPGCAVQKAINNGVLSEDRFNNFYREKNEADYVSKQKNKTKAIDYMKQRKIFKGNS
jgi:putative ribosome biogenesis GTPase RsgA